MNLRMVTKAEFNARALELIQHVEASGKPLIVTENGQPAIEVRCYQGDKRSSLDQLRGSVIELIDPFVPVSPEDWEALR